MQKRSLYLASGTLVLLFVGLIYAWSIFIIPLETVYGWQRSQTIHIFTLSMSFFCIGGILGGYIIRQKTAAFIIRCSAIVMSLGFLACAFSSSLIAIYFSYGVVCSIGVGLVYNAVLSTIVKWFPDKPAQCSGTLLMGFGAGGFLLGTLAEYVIKNFGVRNTFIIFAIICVVVLMIASFYIFAPKENEVQNTSKKTALPKKDIQTKDMLKTPTFWIIFFWSLFSSACALSIIGQAKSIAVEGLNLQGMIVAFAVGLISVFNGVGRVFMGFIYPKMQQKHIMIGINILFLISTGLLAMAIASSNSILVYFSYLLLGYAYGSVPSFGVSIIRELFGSEYYSVNMSVCNLHLIASALIGSSLLGQLFAVTKDYMLLSLLAMGLSVIAVVIAFFFKKPKTA